MEIRGSLVFNKVKIVLRVAISYSVSNYLLHLLLEQSG